ncbi:MAG TPA: GntR family transcriptional regulator [Leeuwenhoekiella sp.]|nr:GntR family transcriptional regulator [Leeuwenhoekiella sp.]
MLEIGAYHKMIIDRDMSPGLYLRNEEDDEVLLPGKYAPANFELEDPIDVFVYLDNEERPVATTLKPFIEKDSFAFLRCTEVTGIGAFVDWGIDKELLVPYSNQMTTMKADESYVVYMYLDEKSGRLVGSTKTPQFTHNEDIEVKKFDKVDLLVSHYSDHGANVIINGKYMGLVFKDAIFEDLRVGDQLPGYIKWVRDDNKIDVVLQPEGYKGIEPNAKYIMEELQANDGQLMLSDKSSPEAIQAQLGISKKSFKKAIGVLYKERHIVIEKDSIHLTSKQ